VTLLPLAVTTAHEPDAQLTVAVAVAVITWQFCAVGNPPVVFTLLPRAVRTPVPVVLVCEACDPAPVINAPLVRLAALVTHVGQAIVPVVVTGPPVMGPVVAMFVTVPDPLPWQPVFVAALAAVQMREAAAPFSLSNPLPTVGSEDRTILPEAGDTAVPAGMVRP